MSNREELVVNLRRSAAFMRLQGHERVGLLMLDAAEALSAEIGEAVDDDDETYQLGKRDGYEEAVQDIDVLTGGDGEYTYCMDGDPDRHCPDAGTMKQRIAERFAAVAHPVPAAAAPAPVADAELVDDVLDLLVHRGCDIHEADAAAVRLLVATHYAPTAATNGEEA